MVIVFLTGCMTSKEPAPEFINQDYYFIGPSSQVQGNAKMPPVEQIIKSQTEEPDITYLATLEERRLQCRASAILNAKTKWLALTLRDIQNQEEWKLRLSLGAKGHFTECLEKSYVRQYFFDAADTCRVVVLFPCLPQNF